MTSVLSRRPVEPSELSRPKRHARTTFPEWIITGTALTDSTTFARKYDPQQWNHAFGVSQLFARGRPEANWSYYLYNWYFGTSTPSKNGPQVIFPMPTTLFAGIQAAGPILTPETFRDGLFNSKAPQVEVSPSRRCPYGNKKYFPKSDYNAIDDTVEIWWDPEASGPDERGEEGKGMYRYVDGGKRYLPGTWPTGDPKVFVNDGTAIALYDKVPDADAPPNYPPPKR